MSACPACGVAIVPGYVRCPKCHAPLPTRSWGAGGAAAGGTALASDGRFPIIPVVIAVALAVGIAAFFGLRSKPAPKAAATPGVSGPGAPVATAPSVQPTPTITPIEETKRGPDPAAVAGELDRMLDKQRLWSTVEVNGSRIEVRSSSCNDPNMSTQLAGVGQALRSAGLTKLRCVEQSGVVVFERDL